jgi:hypothetical protein
MAKIAVPTAFAIAVFCLTGCEPDSEPVAPAAIDLGSADALASKYHAYATTYCKSDADSYLRRASKYAFKWDDIGTFESEFDRYLEKAPAPGVITVVSNKVSLQNGFGAFVRIQLFCIYDTQAKKTLAFSIDEPPRLP